MRLRETVRDQRQAHLIYRSRVCRTDRDRWGTSSVDGLPLLPPSACSSAARWSHARSVREARELDERAPVGTVRIPTDGWSVQDIAVDCCRQPLGRRVSVITQPHVA
ncbi:hypothetical protein StrepF001_22520 [Streptomyces sp. F001]|nr:hypothetical protein StrepF001_22520 [Streptomyces sp. F001]